MATVASPPSGINPGRPDRRSSTRCGTGDPHKLDGADRRAWEESIKARQGLKGSRTLVVLVLLDMTRGKPWAYPSDAYLAAKCGVSENTVWRSLRDLAGLGIIRIVRIRGRRWIVFLGHPCAVAFLAGLGVDGEPAEVAAPIPPDWSQGPGHHVETTAPQIEVAGSQLGIPDPQDGGQSVLVEAESETRHELTPACERGPERSLSGPNELTIPEPGAIPTFDWRKLVAEIGGQAPPPATDGRSPRPKAVDRPMPSIDPAEQAQIIAVAMGEAVAVEAPADIVPVPEPEAHRGLPVNAQGVVDPDAATIEALSKLSPGATRGEILAATIRLASLFRDPGSRAFYRSVCNDVARGQLPARIPIAAVGSARGAGVRKPGAAFTAHIKRCRAAAESRRPMRA